MNDRVLPDQELSIFSIKSDTVLHVGKQKLMHFSEGVKESLRRLSNVIWMAEELHRVADFLLPNISVSTHSCTKFEHLHEYSISTEFL